MIPQTIKYNQDGLLPAIVQDADSGQVLMMAYMNEDSITQSLQTGMTHFWSRSRQKLWMKGETSGHTQEIVSMALDCDQDTLLIKVKQQGGACHTGQMSCFFNVITEDGVREAGTQVFDPEKVYGDEGILQELYSVIVDRRENPKEGSYTNYLFDKGIDKILKKVGEETAEAIIAAKNGSKSELTYEVSDLFYHLMVLLADQEVSLEDIFRELRKRR